LNNAATSHPKAPGVVEAVVRSLEELPVEPSRSTLVGTSNPVGDCRSALASRFAVPPERVVLTTGATHAANLAAWGLAANGPLHAIATAAEHNAVLRTLRHASERSGGSLRIAPLSNGDVDLEALERLLGSGPASLVACTHASNVTGRVLDAAAAFALAASHGCTTLLDASQSAGAVPVLPTALGADLTIVTGHKALLGPAGTGALLLGATVELPQVFVGGTGTRSDLQHHPTDLPTAYEAGTPNLPGLAGLGAALEWWGAHPDAAPRALRAAERLRSSVRQIEGVHLVDDAAGASRTPIVALTVDGWDVVELGYALEESFGVIGRAGLHCAPLVHEAVGAPFTGSFRFSPGPFTSDDDLDHAVSALEKVATCTS